MNGLGDALKAREALVAAVLDMLAAERRLSADTASVTQVTRCETAVSLAARDLTSAINDLPLSQHPKGWATS